MDKALIVNSKEIFSQLAGKTNIEKQRRKSNLAVSFIRVGTPGLTHKFLILPLFSAESCTKPFQNKTNIGDH